MSSQPANVTGAINVRYGIEMELAINAIAARHGMRRNQWLMKLAREALDADQDGRPLFQEVEGPRLDTSLNVLASQLREVLVEWDRLRRESDRREKRAIELLAEGEEANRLSLERVNRLIVQSNQQSYEPFVEMVRDLVTGLNTVDRNCAIAIDARLDPLAEKIEQIHALASEPRVKRYIVFDKNWVLARWPLTVAAALAISLGVLAGLIVPGLTNDMAVGQAGHLITSADRMCRLIVRQYNAQDCNVPASIRKLGRTDGMGEAAK